MSSRLDTVHRVARLREAGARAAVAVAQRAHAQAAQEHAGHLAALGASTVTAGTSGHVQAGFAGVERHADTVAAAGTLVLEREQDRQAALSGWVLATRHERLLGQVCERHRSEAAEHAERRTQRLLDDLAGRRDSEGAP